jgi:hypothetical protein
MKIIKVEPHPLNMLMPQKNVPSITSLPKLSESEFDGYIDHRIDELEHIRRERKQKLSQRPLTRLL